MTKDLNKLAKEIHDANKAKGFHEVKHSEEHMLCLVISELMEAVEADRKGRRADMKKFEEAMLNVVGVNQESYDKMFAEHFNKFMKDCIEDELADAVIRLLDTAGALDIDARLFRSNFNVGGNSFTENVYDIIKSCVMNQTNISIPYAVGRIQALCQNLEIDLWKHAELKLYYNSLRPYKHGKTY